MKPYGSRSATVLERCIWVRKWLDPDLDGKVSKFGVSGFENGLIKIWTKRCPNEAIWEQICNGFGKVYLGLKMA